MSTHRRAGVALIIAAASLSCTSADIHERGVRLPDSSAWVDCGTVLPAAPDDAWDRYLWGGFAFSVLQFDGRHLLYYQGADGYDEGAGTVTNRSIGLATSVDGLDFVRYPDNPVITFSPGGDLEEGAVSSALLEHGGRVLLYYGANTAVGGGLVTADGRLAISSDGVGFQDIGVVLDHRDPNVWGAGDEIFPTAAFAHGDLHIVYYIPNGTLQRGRLGVAWIDSAGRLLRSAPARAGRRSIRAWGSATSVQIEPGTYALFLTRRAGSGVAMDVRITSGDAPARLSRPIRSYEWQGLIPRGVQLASDGTWRLYYRRDDQNVYGVMMYPACSAPLN